MVGLVLVSHSRPLALAVQELVRSMSGPSLPLAIAAGAGENHTELGTDAVEISEAIISVQSHEGVLVLMDMGSAILSSETALDLMEEMDRRNVRFCAAPFVEGAVAAGVTANLGAPLDEVYAEASAALKQKVQALNEEGNSGSIPAGASKPENNSVDSQSHQVVKLVVHNPHGLHARPAARLIKETKPFNAEITVRNLANQRGPVSVKSLSSLASLEILQEHEIEVSASGPDATAALARIEALARDGFGESWTAKNSTKEVARRTTEQLVKTAAPIAISGGMALGPIFVFKDQGWVIPEDRIEDVAAESARLKEAVAAAEGILETLRAKMERSVGREHADIYEAQSLALQDPELIGTALGIISGQRKNAAAAWAEATRRVRDRFELVQDEYLRARGADVIDAGRQVLECLGIQPSDAPMPERPSILIAEDLTPQQVSHLSHDLILGVVLLAGGPTAHSSILLKALDLPTLVQARSALPACEGIDLLAFDGATGEIWKNPEPDLLARLKARQAEQQRKAFAESLASTEAGRTLDGRRVQVFANIGQTSEAAAAARSGAEGVGLLRTEFLFLHREAAPGEEEQIQALRAVASEFKHQPIIVRTLDIGGDKEVPYLQMPLENNPFLGVRALRLCFQRKELFTTQLRAILRAGEGRDFRIMFPMVADLSDLRCARAFLEEVHADLVKENLPHLWPIEAGIMIEIPSAALQAEALAEEADFFSIGTNDLTQYTLAADRGNPDLGKYQDPLHPSVLRLIDLVVRGARKRDRLVAVCGEAASDEIAALILVGLGVQELSGAASKIPRLKAALRRHKWEALREMASRALACGSAEEVRKLLPADERAIEENKELSFR
jgi:phosphocarrier protein FPr